MKPGWTGCLGGVGEGAPLRAHPGCRGPRGWTRGPRPPRPALGFGSISPKVGRRLGWGVVLGGPHTYGYQPQPHRPLTTHRGLGPRSHKRSSDCFGGQGQVEERGRGGGLRSSRGWEPGKHAAQPSGHTWPCTSPILAGGSALLGLDPFFSRLPHRVCGSQLTWASPSRRTHNCVKTVVHEDNCVTASRVSCCCLLVCFNI